MWEGRGVGEPGGFDQVPHCQIKLKVVKQRHNTKTNSHKKIPSIFLSDIGLTDKFLLVPQNFWWSYIWQNHWAYRNRATDHNRRFFLGTSSHFLFTCTVTFILYNILMITHLKYFRIISIVPYQNVIVKTPPKKLIIYKKY
jgi:hypothetical protein